MVLTFVLLLRFGISGQISAQQRSVRGTVTDSQGSSLPGVTVVVKKTTKGTVTDADGNYSISGVSPDQTLVFSFVGMKKQEVIVRNQTIINVTMEEDAIGIEEVVAIGYGTQTKRELSSSVTQLNENSFQQSTNTSIDQLMEGKAPGVQIVQMSGEPGAGMSVDIRGVGSINAGSSPLYVVDGLPIQNNVMIGGTGNQVTPSRSPRNPISFLNPSDIKSIEILKDASATAIYGARGANGVILITTKSGEAGELKIDYNGHVGFNSVHKRLDLLNPQEYMEGINALIDMGHGDPSERVNEIQNGGTDWQDVIYEDMALAYKNNLSFSWGNGETNYLVSVDNTKENGLVKNTSFERYGVRFNLNHQSEKVNFGISTTSSYIKDIYVPNGFDVNLRGGVINAAKLWDPTRSVRDENGDYTVTDFFDIDNPMAIIYGNHMEGNRYRTLGTMFLEYFVLPELGLKIRAGGDMNNEDKNVYKDRTTIIGKSLGGVATAYTASQSNYLIEGLANYKNDYGDHTFDILAGITTQKFIRDYRSQQANNFPTDATLAYNFGLADRATLVNSSSKSANKLLSYLGRINYKFKDRYLLTASYRIDGSSRFGEGNRFGYFPSISLGWLIDQEKYFKSDVFDMLKLRASWGQTGNQEIGNYTALITFSTGPVYVLDDKFVTSLNPSRIANPDLQWETTVQTDIGIDFSLFEGRLSGIFDWYQKQTEDMLLNLPVPTSSGYTSKRVNIGSIKNSGIEFMLQSYNISKGNFKWTSDLNFTTLKNEVVDLGGIQEIITGSFSVAAGNFGLIRPGEPLMAFYGYEIEGIWQERDDFSSITNNVKPGDFKFRDQNDDDIIDSRDRVVIGKSFPDFVWGFSNSFKYKRFDLNVSFTGVEGIEMVNGNLMEQYFPRSGTRINRFSKPFLNRWTPTNPSNNQPSYDNLNQHSQGINTKTVVDASYIKLHNVRLSYNLPQTVLKNNIRFLEIYATGLNLLTISDYDGHDPALNPNGDGNFRIDWNGYPSARTLLIGVNLGF